jgi:pimeloyl-ACP methyl ester carboxylesterase
MVSLLGACAAPLGGSPVTPTPTAAPTATPEPGTLYFATEDGVTLSGQIYGQGTTALILSNGKEQGKDVWHTIAPQLASRGYLTVLYDYRGVNASQGQDDPDLRDRDLRAAAALAHAHGATSVVLIGSSFGGLLSVKLAAEVKPIALVILSAPLQDGNLSVTTAELQALTAPKLFIDSQQDTPYVGDVQQMYDTTPQPKQIHIYPGTAHGTAILLYAATSADAMQRLLSFLQANAPATSKPA